MKELKKRLKKKALKSKSMKVIVGLGNPGPRYQQTRHNIGFMIVDELASRYGLSFRSGKSDYMQAIHTEKDFGLFKPLSYMNNSGQPVRAIMDWYKLTPQDLFVIMDDLDLPYPALRIRAGGSSGGHKGLDSIIRHIGSRDIGRLRVGITNDDRNFQATESFVLSKFNPEERTTLPETISRGADAVEYYLKNGLTDCMNLYNRKPQHEPDENQAEVNS